MKFRVKDYINNLDNTVIRLKGKTIQIKARVEKGVIDFKEFIEKNEEKLFTKRKFVIVKENEEELKVDRESKKNIDIAKNFNILVRNKEYLISIMSNKLGILEVVIQPKKYEIKEYKMEAIYLSKDTLHIDVNTEIHKKEEKELDNKETIAMDFDIKEIDKRVSLILVGDSNRTFEFENYDKIKENFRFKIDINEFIYENDFKKFMYIKIGDEIGKVIIDKDIKLEEKNKLVNGKIKTILMKKSKSNLLTISMESNLKIRPIIKEIIKKNNKIMIRGSLNSNLPDEYLKEKKIELSVISKDNFIIKKELYIEGDSFSFEFVKEEFENLKKKEEGVWTLGIVIQDEEEKIYPLKGDSKKIKEIKDKIRGKREIIDRTIKINEKSSKVNIILKNIVTIKKILNVQFLSYGFKVRYRTKEDVTKYLDSKTLIANIKIQDKLFRQIKIKKAGKKTFEVEYKSKVSREELKNSLTQNIEVWMEVDKKGAITRIKEVDSSLIYDNYIQKKKNSNKYKKICLKLYEKILLRMPVKKKRILFESFLGRNVSGNPKYLYNYLVEKDLDKEYELIWILNDLGEQIEGKHKKIKRGSFRYYYYMATSGYWIFNCRQADKIKKRKETIYLQTWHGTPLKKLGMDMESVSMAGQNDIEDYKKKFYNNSRRWDYLISQNDYSTDIFSSAFAFDKKILDYGYPANDILYNKNNKNDINKLKEKLSIPKDKKVILYAPTWRDDNFYKKGHYRMKMELELEKMRNELGNEYIVLLRMHYLITNSINIEDFEGFAYDFSTGFDIQELYLVTDILITDYSSVMFDFANLKRDTIFYTYDIERYRDSLRGFYFDFEKEAPGPLVKTTDEVIECVKNLKSIRKNYNENKIKFYNKFCHIDNGQAAKKIFEEILV